MIPLTRKTLGVLLGVLVLQGLLAVVLLMPREQSTEPFLTFDVAGIDRILVSGESSNEESEGELPTIDLTRLEPEGVSNASGENGSGDADAWVMSGNLQVDSARVDSLMEALFSERTSWPVASTQEAARRFEVTSGKHQRKLEFHAGDEAIATLYLGTSPSFRRIHAREANSDRIYAIELATYDLPMNRDDWLDKSLLQVAGSLNAMSRLGAWEAELVGEGDWRFRDASLEANSAALSAMATRFETLRVMGVSGMRPEREADVEFEVSAAGQNVGYAFYRVTDPDAADADAASDESANPDAETQDALVKSSLRDEFFRISGYTLDQLAKPIAELVVETNEDAPPDDGQATGPDEDEAA